MWYYVKFMKFIAYIVHSKMILQVMLKGDKMATSHLILKDHLTKIPCTNMINDICITFKVAHIIPVTCPRFVSYLLYMHCVVFTFLSCNYQANIVKIQCVTSVVESEKKYKYVHPIHRVINSLLCITFKAAVFFFY